MDGNNEIYFVWMEIMNLFRMDGNNEIYFVWMEIMKFISYGWK